VSCSIGVVALIPRVSRGYVKIISEFKIITNLATSVGHRMTGSEVVGRINDFIVKLYQKFVEFYYKLHRLHLWCFDKCSKEFRLT
jgi:hypothetical protein